MKIQKSVLGLAAVFATLTLLNACQSHKEEKPKQDCSAIFETRDANGRKIQTTTQQNPAILGQATECKVLEVKLEKDLTCEIVGSDKIDNLKTALTENDSNKTVLITSTTQLRDLGLEANKHVKFTKLLKSDVFKNFSVDSDLFKNLDNFPYKGLRCHSSGKQFVVWTGQKKVIATFQDK